LRNHPVATTGPGGSKSQGRVQATDFFSGQRFSPGILWLMAISNGLHCLHLHYLGISWHSLFFFPEPWWYLLNITQRTWGGVISPRECERPQKTNDVGTLDTPRWRCWPVVLTFAERHHIYIYVNIINYTYVSVYIYICKDTYVSMYIYICIPIQCVYISIYICVCKGIRKKHLN
jgi:hypothetical protein